MTKEMLKSWLEAYGRAWETRSPETACSLFTDDATYQETPFLEAMRGRRAIEDYWSRATGSHADVHSGYEILALNGSEGIAHWWCSFVRLPAQAPLKLDGIFVLQFDDQGQCTALREWWHRQENRPPTPS